MVPERTHGIRRTIEYRPGATKYQVARGTMPLSRTPNAMSIHELQYIPRSHEFMRRTASACGRGRVCGMDVEPRCSDVIDECAQIPVYVKQ